MGARWNPADLVETDEEDNTSLNELIDLALHALARGLHALTNKYTSITI